MTVGAVTPDGERAQWHGRERSSAVEQRVTARPLLSEVGAHPPSAVVVVVASMVVVVVAVVVGAIVVVVVVVAASVVVGAVVVSGGRVGVVVVAEGGAVAGVVVTGDEATVEVGVDGLVDVGRGGTPVATCVSVVVAGVAAGSVAGTVDDVVDVDAAVEVVVVRRSVDGGTGPSDCTSGSFALVGGCSEFDPRSTTIRSPPSDPLIANAAPPANIASTTATPPTTVDLRGRADVRLGVTGTNLGAGAGPAVDVQSSSMSAITPDGSAPAPAAAPDPAAPAAAPNPAAPASWSVVAVMGAATVAADGVWGFEATDSIRWRSAGATVVIGAVMNRPAGFTIDRCSRAHSGHVLR